MLPLSGNVRGPWSARAYSRIRISITKNQSVCDMIFKMKKQDKKFDFKTFINSDAYKEFSETIKKINAMTLSIMEQTKPLTDALNAYKASLPNFNDYLNPMYEAAKQFSEVISKQLDNPDSALSYYQYFESLSNFFWVMPYKITSKQIKDLIKGKRTEEEFDSFMLEYFNDSILENLFKDIAKRLPEKQNILLAQCINSFKNQDYALCSLGLYSVIEDVTSFYLKDKGCVTRKGLFNPIVEVMMEKDSLGDMDAMDFILLMMDKNIDILYENTRFENDVSINRHKDTNRHATAHGKYYSNRKESDLMLFNSLYWLLGLQDYLNTYEGRLERDKNKNGFHIIKED